MKIYDKGALIEPHEAVASLFVYEERLFSGVDEMGFIRTLIMLSAFLALASFTVSFLPLVKTLLLFLLMFASSLVVRWLINQFNSSSNKALSLLLLSFSLLFLFVIMGALFY